MNSIKWLFMSKYKKLLYRIECAKSNEQVLHLPNGVVIDFTSSHEYDSCSTVVLPRKNDGDLMQKYSNNIGQMVHMDVYDCFGGDVIIREIKSDRVLVEIVDVAPCYACQKAPSPGSKCWIMDWEIAHETTSSEKNSAFNKEDLPF